MNGVLLWSETSHYVCWPLGKVSNDNQSQLLPVLSSDPIGRSYKVICSLATCAELAGAWEKPCHNLGQIPLVPGLGLLTKRYRTHGGQILVVRGLWTFDRFLGKFKAQAEASHL